MSLTYQELDTHFDRGPETRILCLLKVGAKDHLEELRAGRLRFRRLSYYRDIEQKAEVHFDANEGVVSVLQADRIKLMFKAADKTIEVNAQTGLVGQVVVRANDDRPVFCFHTLHTGEWFSETGVTGQIGRITPGGKITETPVPGGGSPAAMAEGPDGNVWFIDNGALVRVAPDGTMAEFPAFPPNPSVSAPIPVDLTAGPDGAIWFTARSPSIIGRFVPP